MSPYNNFMPTIVVCKYALARTLLLCITYHCVNSLRKWTITCFNPNLLECGGAMRPQRKIMMVETTHAFVKLKQIKAAVSAGGIKFDWFSNSDCLHHRNLNISASWFWSNMDIRAGRSWELKIRISAHSSIRHNRFTWKARVRIRKCKCSVGGLLWCVNVISIEVVT